jgi:predicted alpha/beta hydrolase family esterase
MSGTASGKTNKKHTATMRTKVLILPGIGSSGPQHWQTLWEKANPAFLRVEQEDWITPNCSDWVDRLETAVAESGPDTILVAHSLACLLVAHWAASTRHTIKGALLVAPPDPAGVNFPKGISGFAPIPELPLPFKSILIASSDDHYASLEFSRKLAATFGSEYIELDALGHINADSEIGEWADGFAIFKDFLKEVG